MLTQLFQVKLHVSARQSNLLQPRKKMQRFAALPELLCIFSTDCSFKNSDYNPKNFNFGRNCFGLCIHFLSHFFLPTISALLCLLTGLGSHTLVAFRSVSSKRSASCSWRHGNMPRGNPGGGTVPSFQWSFEIKNTQRRNTSRFCLPSFHDVIPFCHSHWP